MNKVSVSTTSTEFVSLKVYEKLIAELRCPGCSVPMKRLIRLCERGHSICEDCTKMLDSCPLCKKRFTLTRNLTLEAVCLKAEFPCENSINGCHVRCTTSLLEWHERQCRYRIVKCFIGKVWGKCEWKGLEKNWLEHINTNHLDKVFKSNPTELNCHIKNDLKPLTAYYIFQMYNQSFSFYQIFDKINGRILWTMSYEPSDKKLKFTFEIDVYDTRDPFKRICQRYECHHNSDKDILRDGACATMSIGDILRFVDENKILHYRIQIHKIDNVKEGIFIKNNEQLPNDFNQTSIEGVNLKQVPSSVIITRKVETDQSPTSIEINAIQNDESIMELPSSESDSESDPELEDFVNNLFKTKFSMNSDMSDQKNIVRPRKQEIFKRFSKSCQRIKSGFIELQSLHRKKSKPN